MEAKIVYVGIPSRTKGFWDAYTNLLNACTIAGREGIFCTLDPHVGSSLICRARQNITYKFLFENTKAEYFLQIDDDIALPPNAIVDLVNAIDNGADVVGGLYSLKSKAGLIAMRMLDTSRQFKVGELDSAVIEVQYVATGCFMQSRKTVVDAWDHYKPSRSYVDNHDKKERVALYTPFIHRGEYLSEDYAYCQRLKDMGKKIWAHTGVRCGHWGLAQYGVV